jgi:hypothetical protein
MEKINRKALVLIVLLFFFLFLTVNPSVKADSVQVDSNTYFGFTNGWMNFTSTQTFYTVQEIGNYWYFDNVGISLDGANATISSWLVNSQVVLNLVSLGGTCTILMNVTSLNPTITVTGADSYSLDATQSLLTITKASFSTTTITINVSPVKIYGFTVTNYDLAQNVPFTLTATVYDEWGIISLTNVNLELSYVYQITVAWSLGGFSIPTGSGNCYLDSSGCSVIQIDSYTDLISWKLTWLGTTPEQSVDVLGSGTVATDIYGNTGTNSTVNLATYPGVPNQGQGSSNPPPTNPTNQTQPQNPTNQTTPSNNTQTNPINPVNPNNQSGPFLPPTSPIIPAVEMQAPFSPMILFVGLILIFVIVGVTGFYSGRRRKNPLSGAQKEWDKQNRGKNPKWNRD